MITQRDEFINQIYNHAVKDKEMIFLSADFGAPSLDKFRKNLPDQFIHCGISEQNMVDLAGGLALDGRKVILYAMAPFVTLRCLEQHKCTSGIMNLPICTIVAGIGLGYANSGPTHYATEDYACLRSLVNCCIYTASDPLVASKIASNYIANPHFCFVRLDRDPGENIFNSIEEHNFSKGYRILNEGNDLFIVTHGIMNQKILNIINKNSNLKSKVCLLDLIRSKPISKEFVQIASKFKKILVIDEQIPSGNLFSAISETLTDNKIYAHLHRMSLPEKYLFENGGREYLLKISHLDEECILKKIQIILNNLL